VKLVSEGKEIIAQAKKEFVAKASGKLASIVETTLKGELSTLKEDIQTAKENMFGRKIFETFAAEFTSSHLAEGTTVSKLTAEMAEVKAQLAEAQSVVAKKETIIAEAEKKAASIKEANERKATLDALLSPLAAEKRELMGNLLESVQTDKLSVAYKKYLPTVLNESVKSKSQTITESQKTEVTGNKASTQISESDAEIINLKKLAGIQ
jgi:hypothetical protein